MPVDSLDLVVATRAEEVGHKAVARRPLEGHRGVGGEHLSKEVSELALSAGGVLRGGGGTGPRGNKGLGLSPLLRSTARVGVWSLLLVVVAVPAGSNGLGLRLFWGAPFVLTGDLLGALLGEARGQCLGHSLPRAVTHVELHGHAALRAALRGLRAGRNRQLGALLIAVETRRCCALVVATHGALRNLVRRLLDPVTRLHHLARAHELAEALSRAVELLVLLLKDLLADTPVLLDALRVKATAAVFALDQRAQLSEGFLHRLLLRLLFLLLIIPTRRSSPLHLCRAFGNTHSFAWLVGLLLVAVPAGGLRVLCMASRGDLWGLLVGLALLLLLAVPARGFWIPGRGHRRSLCLGRGPPRRETKVGLQLRLPRRWGLLLQRARQLGRLGWQRRRLPRRRGRWSGHGRGWARQPTGRARNRAGPRRCAGRPRESARWSRQAGRIWRRRSTLHRGRPGCAGRCSG
mmetsp:Transcript_7369/g.23399  ORF Transcript_7369/g.23399 Transcript_7369/m.23399 type:complete len:462 (+) Transcript_7369:287-1672(+)